ncbi:MAG TPA: alpha/beta hydrolase [Candidatus Acidoferrum sp.]|nr:alpha/beta hydrolase [Candidatus Acidoferrum sp.]
MSRIISRISYGLTLLLPFPAFVLLAAVSGSGGSHARVEQSFLSSQESQNVTATKSELQVSTDPQVKTILDKMAAAGVARPTTVADVRKAYLFYPKLSGTPEQVFRIEDRQIPGPGGNIPLRVYTPSSTSGLPVLVFFHGGGFVAGSLDSHDAPLRSVANRCACIVVSVAYRLAPENKYPAAPEDAYSATKWVAEHGGDIGGDPRRIAVGGDGAGGNLAAVVTLMARERGTPNLVFQLLIYPSLDFSTVRPSWWEETDAPTISREAKRDISIAYLPITVNLRDPFIAPIHAKDLKNLPPALLITYEGDNPMRPEGEEYAERLKQDGVAVKVSVYPKVLHGFFLMAGDLDEGKRCIDEVAAALKIAFEGRPRDLP